MTLLTQHLQAGEFVCILESLPNSTPEYPKALNELAKTKQLAGMPLVLAFADRVSLDAPDPVSSCQLLSQPHEGLIHFSGKDRTEPDLLHALQRISTFASPLMLLLSGDRLPGHQPNHDPVRYLESVNALMIARQQCPHGLYGAALNPFKYFAEESAAQYLKGEKKLLAGADFLTLQLGFDITKQSQALAWMQQQATPKPMLACVMALTAARAAFLTKVPGVVISDSLRQHLSHQQQENPNRARLMSTARLALHIHGLKLMGFAGVHLSGIHHRQALAELEAQLIRVQQHVHSLSQWHEAWAKDWGDVNFAPTRESCQPESGPVRASTLERLRYHALHTVHQTLFAPSHPLGRAFGWAVRQPLWQQPKASAVLARTEYTFKHPTVGCQLCGTCRLNDTLYVCPETCPKGLANGPCGGTHLNRCEFGDRECIHSLKYRLACTVGQVAVLSQTLIPHVPEQSRGESSWPRWFKR